MTIDEYVKNIKEKNKFKKNAICVIVDLTNSNHFTTFLGCKLAYQIEVEENLLLMLDSIPITNYLTNSFDEDILSALYKIIF